MKLFKPQLFINLKKDCVRYEIFCLTQERSDQIKNFVENIMDNSKFPPDDWEEEYDSIIRKYSGSELLYAMEEYGIERTYRQLEPFEMERHIKKLEQKVENLKKQNKRLKKQLRGKK